ncbi:MAG TPA: peptidyl-prolyl cis-trans isomerase [Candidatus Aminicenantes bacterium]|nr:peptidyl-prolyl cis-trans isomerase [Candidatus Aminicenantes bacterium]HRY66150.1 peptidyl-prolyl cis-trans isomerase [Candidatus Aminicenantes bacterium]HRZ73064.1 peptidyl-prolyl cis-trans isomerase [Candidatus Aminicenantes bacterium]
MCAHGGGDRGPRLPGRRPALRALAALAALGLLACGRDEGRAAVSKVAGLVQGRFRDGLVLRVEKTEFRNADFRAYLEVAGAAATDLPAESLSRLFDRFVDEEILFEAARQRGISLTEDEKKEYLAKLAVAAMPGAEDKDREAAPPERAFDRLLVEKYTFLVVRDVRVEASEILDYYEQHKKEFLQPGRVQVSQILVDTEEKAVSVVRRLERTGEEEFRRIAREESLGPEAARGGVMGVFAQGDLPADMEKVIFALDEGRTSQAVESSYGYHIFRLDRKHPPALQAETEAAPEIQQRIMAQKMKEALAVHLAGLKDTLSWEQHPENLFFKYQRSVE